MNLEIGTVLADYEIVGVLGAGGMGKVFKVRNTISDRVEAMKILLPDLHGAPDLADRFLREIKVLASLDHPNIAGLRTAFRYENQLLMIMELVEGITLDQRLRQGPLSVNEAVSCIGQVLSALGYAHRSGVIHRDIKPANMMLTSQGTVKLLDFGIAKGGEDRKLTMTGTTIGSLYYMSPEQIRGSSTLDPRADIYSLGVSVYELVTGRRPFDGDSQFAIMSAHLEKNPVPPIVIDPRLPQSLNDVILKSVEREADQRFQTAEAFRNALNSVTAAQATTVPLAARPAIPPPPAPTPPMPVAQPKGSPRILWVAVGGLCAVGALVAVVQFGPWKKTEAGSMQTTPPAVTAPAPSTPPTAQSEVAPAPPPISTPQPATAQQTPSIQPAVREKISSGKGPRAADPAPTGQALNPAPEHPAGALPQPFSPPAAQPAPAPQQADQTAHRAELQTIRESAVKVSARAGAIRSMLQNLQQSQAASGLGLRRDWVQAGSLMDSYLQGANSALNAGDAASAKDLLEKGERQLEILEKALNR